MEGEECGAGVLVLGGCQGNCAISLSQLWDIGGQPRFRSMWERYCRGVSAIV